LAEFLSSFIWINSIEQGREKKSEQCPLLRMQGFRFVGQARSSTSKKVGNKTKKGYQSEDHCAGFHRNNQFRGKRPLV
jgi:hypothetical protein